MTTKIKPKTNTKLDLTGQRFGRLVVIKEAEPRRSKRGVSERWWLCRCDCGVEREFLQSNLRSGKSKSCGCLLTDILVERNLNGIKRNQYDLTGDYGIGYTSNGTSFTFNLEDYEKICNYTWNVNSLNYITAHNNTPDRKTLYLHRVIFGLSDEDWKDTQVDHIDGDPTNNVRSNLRIVNASDNGKNKKPYRNNKTGVSGVTQLSNNKWRARINIEKNTRINLGCFDTKEEAVAARKKAEEKYYGEYSYNNSRKPKE